MMTSTVKRDIDRFGYIEVGLAYAIEIYDDGDRSRPHICCTAVLQRITIPDVVQLREHLDATHIWYEPRHRGIMSRDNITLLAALCETEALSGDQAIPLHIELAFSNGLVTHLSHSDTYHIRIGCSVKSPDVPGAYMTLQIWSQAGVDVRR